MCFPFPWTCPLLKTTKFVCMLVLKMLWDVNFFGSLFVLKLITYYIWAEMQIFIVRKYIIAMLYFHCLCQRNLR